MPEQLKSAAPDSSSFGAPDHGTLFGNEDSESIHGPQVARQSRPDLKVASCQSRRSPSATPTVGLTGRLELPRVLLAHRDSIYIIGPSQCDDQSADEAVQWEPELGFSVG